MEKNRNKIGDRPSDNYGWGKFQGAGYGYNMEADKYRGYYGGYDPEENFAQQYNRRYGPGNEYTNEATFYDLPAQYTQETRHSGEPDVHHRGKGPRGYRRSDQRLYEDVNERLYDDHLLDATDIEVKVEDGVVILSGEEENRFGKRRAEEIAESVPGVTNVENRLHTNRNVVKDVTRAFTSGIADSSTGYTYDKYKRERRGW